jgi:uncharacterized protein with PIN domain
MPFSSLDPADLARAAAALEAAWIAIRANEPDASERERLRLAYIVTSLVPVTTDQDDLARRAVERYQNATA